MIRTKLVLCIVLSLIGAALNAVGFAEDSEQTLEALLAQAGSAQARGDFVAASEFYRKSVEINPSIPELWANLGLMYHETGKHTEAIQSFKRAIQLNQTLFVPQLFLGIEYMAEKDPKTALPFLKRAAKLNPRDVQAATSLGHAYSMIEDGAEAAESYRAATQLAPANGNVWLWLGTAYLQQVESDARTMNSTYKDSSYVKLRAAETFAEEGKLVEADTAYKSTLATQSVAPCAHAEYGITLLRLKRQEEAQKQFQLERQDGESCPLLQLASQVAMIASGGIEKGTDGLFAIVSEDPALVQSSLPIFRDVLTVEQVRALNELVTSKQNSGSISGEIARIITRSFVPVELPPTGSASVGQQPETPVSNLSSKPDKPQGNDRSSACRQVLKHGIEGVLTAQLREIASCAFYAGDYRTTEVAAQSLKGNPATIVQGLYWESKADQKMAIAALTRAGEIEPNSPQMRVLIGDVFRQKRHWSEAEAEYRKAVALDPKNRSARLGLAIVLFSELEYEEAFSIDKSLLEESSDDPEANFLAGEILAQQHEYTQAEPFLARCGKLDEDLQPRLHILRGQVYAETGRLSEAIAEYRLGLSSDRDGSAHYQLARLYQKAGDSAAAAEQIRISKQLRERWDNQAHVAFEQRATDVSKQ